MTLALVIVLAAGVSASCSSASTGPVAANPIEDAPDAAAADASVTATTVAVTADAAATASIEPTATPESTAVIQPRDDGLKLLAHRGLHHTYDREGIERDTCTAERIYPVEHDYFENTVASIEAAFALGAEVIEIDIAPSSDGVLVVFHDWTVDCRTEGTGEVRSLTWDELSKLDIGYGYTADGQTFPLRGKGTGLMPRLDEVLAAFPDGQFLINFKSRNLAEAELLHEVIQEADAAEQVWGVYGGEEAVEAYMALAGARGFTEASVLACGTRYLTAAAEAEDLCSDTIMVVPLDLAELLPGWPRQFVEEMTALGTRVVITGPDGSGIDTVATFASLPQDLDAYVWTDRIELLGPEA